MFRGAYSVTTSGDTWDSSASDSGEAVEIGCRRANGVRRKKERMILGFDAVNGSGFIGFCAYIMPRKVAGVILLGRIAIH